MWHLAEPCPEWLKQVWIDWLGPERIFELYGGTEGQTATVITRRGVADAPRLGRPTAAGHGRDPDDDGNGCRPDEMGEVWLRRPDENRRIATSGPSRAPT